MAKRIISSHRRRSRVYDAGGAERASAGTQAEQGDYMRAQPYLAPGQNRDVEAGDSSTVAPWQRGQHGEGAEITGNSARGALSGGLSGATTTRGGQQGGIGASVHDPEPTLYDGERASDPGDVYERDLTLGEQHGGAMATPHGPINSALATGEVDEVDEHNIS